MIKQPKTIFEGKGDAGIIVFERALATELATYFRKGGAIRREITVDMPVIGKYSQQTTIKIVILLKAPLPANPASVVFSTWYIDSAAFSNPKLVR
jgi:hypothetical protein